MSALSAPTKGTGHPEVVRGGCPVPCRYAGEPVENILQRELVFHPGFRSANQSLALLEGTRDTVLNGHAGKVVSGEQ